jgi:hypothetical protein
MLKEIVMRDHPEKVAAIMAIAGASAIVFDLLNLKYNLLDQAFHERVYFHDLLEGVALVSAVFGMILAVMGLFRKDRKLVLCLVALALNIPVGIASCMLLSL